MQRTIAAERQKDALTSGIHGSKVPLNTEVEEIAGGKPSLNSRRTIQRDRRSDRVVQSAGSRPSSVSTGPLVESRLNSSQWRINHGRPSHTTGYIPAGKCRHGWLSAQSYTRLLACCAYPASVAVETNSVGKSSKLAPIQHRIIFILQCQASWLSMFRGVLICSVKSLLRDIEAR